MRKISLEGYLCPKSLAFKQILRTMKITLILLLTTAFSAFSMDVHSQNAKVSLDTNIMKVAQLISAIESQTNYLFVYSKKNVDLSRKVKINAKNNLCELALGLSEHLHGLGVALAHAGAQGLGQLPGVPVALPGIEAQALLDDRSELPARGGGQADGVPVGHLRQWL